MAINFNQSGKQILVDLFNETNGAFTGLDFTPADVEFSEIRKVNVNSRNTEIKMKVVGNNRYRNSSQTFFYNRLDIAKWPLVENALLFRSTQANLIRYVDLLPEINRVCNIQLDVSDIVDGIIPRTTFGTGVNEFFLTMSDNNLVFIGKLPMKWVVVNTN